MFGVDKQSDTLKATNTASLDKTNTEKATSSETDKIFSGREVSIFTKIKSCLSDLKFRNKPNKPLSNRNIGMSETQSKKTPYLSSFSSDKASGERSDVKVKLDSLSKKQQVLEASGLARKIQNCKSFRELKILSARVKTTKNDFSKDQLNALKKLIKIKDSQIKDNMYKTAMQLAKNASSEEVLLKLDQAIKDGKYDLVFSPVHKQHLARAVANRKQQIKANKFERANRKTANPRIIAERKIADAKTESALLGLKQQIEDGKLGALSHEERGKLVKSILDKIVLLDDIKAKTAAANTAVTSGYKFAKSQNMNFVQLKRQAKTLKETKDAQKFYSDISVGAYNSKLSDAEKNEIRLILFSRFKLLKR